MASHSKHSKLSPRLTELFPEATESDLLRANQRRSPRWRITTAALLAVLLVAGAGALLSWLNGSASLAHGASGPPSESVPIAVPAANSASPSSTGKASTPSGAVVQVVGAVAKPGVLTLPVGSRIFQAISAAGGALPSAELAALNLAAIVQDGQQIRVPTHQEAAGGSGGSPDSAGSGKGSAQNGSASGLSTAKVAAINLNTASAEDLASLPRVGPVLAQRIVDWRTEHGAFNSVQDLDAVDGIGTKLLESLSPLVVV
ncbi:competence protein ComEA [Psychromicrobium silvestre]|uniref:Competence protein ComEA n=1 Tax=Psychromicrobium silvestre TaxID=1645614 RepID=A0A7Y9LRP8_9MICC|nr:helix-hairpin-helix domain-containing protein [Psychromicrobium silvestre]NYE94363.1 competence protein ComEA [Psychromicrobium silvestre]